MCCCLADSPVGDLKIFDSRAGLLLGHALLSRARKKTQVLGRGGGVYCKILDFFPKGNPLTGGQGTIYGGVFSKEVLDWWVHSVRDFFQRNPLLQLVGTVHSRGESSFQKSFGFFQRKSFDWWAGYISWGGEMFRSKKKGVLGFFVTWNGPKLENFRQTKKLCLLFISFFLLVFFLFFLCRCLEDYSSCYYMA